MCFPFRFTLRKFAVGQQPLHQAICERIAGSLRNRADRHQIRESSLTAQQRGKVAIAGPVDRSFQLCHALIAGVIASTWPVP